MKTASTLAQAMDLQALLSPHAVSSLPSEADANPVPTIRSQSLRSCFVSLLSLPLKLSIVQMCIFEFEIFAT